MKRDISSRLDLELLITVFYDKVKEDKLIGFVFNDIISMNWSTHLPLMINFWDNALFFTGAYTGNPMNLHKHLHHIQPLNASHFKRWVELFETSVDLLFKGSNANLAKQRAKSIAVIMEDRISENHNYG